MFEIALVEFFRKYGCHDEINDFLINQKVDERTIRIGTSAGNDVCEIIYVTSADVIDYSKKLARALNNSFYPDNWNL